MEVRYELADRYVFSQLPNWKKAIIVENRTQKTDSRFFDEFAKSVIALAEDFSKDMTFSKKTQVVSIVEKTIDKKEKPVKV